MNPRLDELLVEKVNAVGPTSWSATMHRYTTARRDALSGEGARRSGGRWNPKGLFPTIYLALPVSTCMGEVERAAEARHLTVERMLSVPHNLHELQVTEIDVLDLRSEATRQQVGFAPEDLASEWDICQSVGHAAWFLELGGVLAPSAIGEGLTLALFEHRVRPGDVSLVRTEPLTHARYLDLR